MSREMTLGNLYRKYRVCQKKTAHQTRGPNSVESLPSFKYYIAGRLAVTWLLRIPPHLVYVATLPCETLMPEKQVINDKLQGSVASVSA